MGNEIGGEKCDGCGHTTPFFGEIYGRMSYEQHGGKGDGMCCNLIDDQQLGSDDPIRGFQAFNSFKNNTLIPFYSTVMAIQVIVAAIRSDTRTLTKWGLSFEQSLYINANLETKVLLCVRLSFSLIPIAGNIINGVLDIIAQIGLQFKTSGSADLERDVKEI